MATLTATAAAATGVVRANYGSPTEVVFTYNSGATEISASATTILMGKIPAKCTVTDIIEHHSTGAATCPVDIGIQGALSAFASAATQGAVTRTTAGAGVGYDISVSDDAANQFVYATVTATPGTGTASFKSTLVVRYIMD